jgi:hypothetical protein
LCSISLLIRFSVGALYVLVVPIVQGPLRVIQRGKFEKGELVTRRRGSWVCYIGRRIKL